MEKEPTFTSPDRGLVNKDLSNLEAPKKFAKAPVGESASNEAGGISRRGFLKVVAGSLAAVALGKGIDQVLNGAEEKNEKLSKLDIYLDEVEQKVQAIAQTGNKEIDLICSTALLQIAELREQLRRTSNDLKPDEFKALNKKFIPLHKTLQELEIEIEDKSEDPDKAINAIINI